MILISLISSLIFFTLIRLKNPVCLFPDSVRYLSGEKLHFPFNLRWLIPYVLKRDKRLWLWVTSIATILIPPLTYLYLISLGLNERLALYGSLLVLGLPGIFHFNVIGILIDSIAIDLCLGSAICFNFGLYVPAVVFLILASLSKESSPVWITLFSMSFYPLFAFLIPLAIHYLNPPAKTDLPTLQQPLIQGHPEIRAEYLLKHPLKAGWIYNNWLSPEMYLQWGICIFAVLYTGMAWQWVLAGVVIAYSQCLVATDSARLYQYSFPLVIYAAIQV